MPDFPAWAIPFMSWDLGPVRPWEWWQIDAEEWIEAQAVQAAYRDGITDAREEAAAGKGDRE